MLIISHHDLLHRAVLTVAKVCGKNQQRNQQASTLQVGSCQSPRELTDKHSCTIYLATPPSSPHKGRTESAMFSWPQMGCLTHAKTMLMFPGIFRTGIESPFLEEEEVRCNHSRSKRTDDAALRWQDNSYYEEQRWKTPCGTSLVPNALLLFWQPVQSVLSWGAQSTDSPLCLKKLELICHSELCILILDFLLFQVSHLVWNDSYCLLKNNERQQRSPPNLNRSWQHRIIPSVLKVKGQNGPAMNILLYYLSLTWFTSQFVLFICILGTMQSKLQHHQYTFLEIFQQSGKGPKNIHF